MDTSTRVGRAVPVLTGAVTVVTAAVSITGILVPAVVTALGRDAAALSAGQVWRLVTSLLVQDGGWWGTVSNLLGLIVLGVVAERLCGRGRWALAYLGAGLVGELVGWAGWQPVGAGNSVGVCGLAGLVAVTLATDRHRRDDAAAVAGGVAIGFWAVLMLAGLLPSLVVVLACVLLAVLANLAGSGRLGATVTAGRIGGVLVLVAAVVLLASADIHGSALAAGLVLGALLLLRRR